MMKAGFVLCLLLAGCSNGHALPDSLRPLLDGPEACEAAKRSYVAGLTTIERGLKGACSQNRPELAAVCNLLPVARRAVKLLNDVDESDCDAVHNAAKVYEGVRGALALIRKAGGNDEDTAVATPPDRATAGSSASETEEAQPAAQ